MMSWTALFVTIAYVVVGRWLTGLKARRREAIFALWNLAAVYYFFFFSPDPDLTLRYNLVFAAYLTVVSAQYVALRWWGERPGWLPWLAFLVPIAVLAAIRYAPSGQLAGLFGSSDQGILQRIRIAQSQDFVGLSYLAFRTSYLVLEVRNRVVPRPGLWEYLGFAFFAPTLSVGPISPYVQYRRAFAETDRPQIPISRALLRVLVGAVKFRFFAPLLNQITYSGLLLDGHPHLWVDLLVAAVAYYVYLYCNFSGFCDIAIGGAGLMGISVAENFNNPFAARNVKDFWNRWHITLSHYMRDVVFAPLSKTLVRVFGAAQANQAIALTIFVVFLLVGAWHGPSLRFVAFGAFHGIGVAANHYYTIALKKRLGRESFAAYNQNRVIQAIAVALTFAYVAASLFLFANDSKSMKTIFSWLQLY
jgi:D-alanyl-lipoteichoic acid acyltransferase DltB (MBOAT superfamily)